MTDIARARLLMTMEHDYGMDNFKREWSVQFFNKDGKPFVRLTNWDLNKPRLGDKIHGMMIEFEITPSASMRVWQEVIAEMVIPDAQTIAWHDV